MKSTLPKDWNKENLEDLLDFVIGGDWGKDENYTDPDYELAICIRGAEIKNWDKEKGKTASLRKIKKSNIDKRKLKEGDILVEISGGGPDQPVGRTVLIDRSVLSNNPSLPKVCTNFLRLIRPKDFVNSGFLNYYLKYFYQTGAIVSYQAGSNNLRNLKFPDYLGIKIPLPPKLVQKSIVSKIEELFSELDKAVEQLKTTQLQLKTYRQAMLKWAFEGKYSAGVENWKNMTMREVSSKIVVGYVGPVTQHIVQSGGVKFLSTTHIGENEFLNQEIREVSRAFSDSNKKSQVIPDDIIIARHGDSGKACLIPKWLKMAQVSNAVILRVNPEIALPKFVCYRLNAERQRMQKMKVGGVFQVVNTKSMESFRTLIPPLKEQHKIVKEIESHMSAADKLEETINNSLQQAEALRQSILKQAFEGRLV